MNFRALIREHVPTPAIRWVRRKLTQAEARRRSRTRDALLRKYGTFTTQQLIQLLHEAGIEQDGILFVQCSYNDLHTYSGSPYELVCGLRELVGPKGTLLMPAYTENMQQTPCRPFDVRREPTYTGIAAELFRREEGVFRSLHPRHSLCGIGPRAQELLEGHENCVYADGQDSPFDRLQRAGAQSVCLGLTPGFTSFVHWLEDIEPEKHPTTAHDGPHQCVLRDHNGQELRRPFYRRVGGQVMQAERVARNLSPEAMKQIRFYGIWICIYPLPILAAELLKLRDRGIVYYKYSA
jgi:aminoglycoside N3'-acetyltransferase